MASARLEEIIEKYVPSSEARHALEAHFDKMRNTRLRQLFAADPGHRERMTAYYIDDIRRARELADKKIHYTNVGTDSGLWGLECASWNVPVSGHQCGKNGIEVLSAMRFQFGGHHEKSVEKPEVA